MKLFRRLLLLAAAGAAMAGCRLAARKPPSAPPAPAAWDVAFRDVAGDAGIRYQLGHGGKSPLTILETAPGGCAFVDLDGDGWLDLVLVGPPRCAVYRNLRNGRFQDVTAEMGLSREGSWMGCAVGDYDGDGFPDLLLTGYGCVALLHNEGGRRFRDVTRAAGIRTDLWTTSAAFADVDGDGWLDLYVGAYLDYRPGRQDFCQLAGIPTLCGPEMYAAQRGRLYRNLGNGRFKDITEASGLNRATGKTWGVAFSDYDADGRPDLYLANDQAAGNLFHNLGGGRFEDLGTLSGTAYDAAGNVQGGMGVDWGDVDGDGRPDLLVSTYVLQVKEIYHNDGKNLFHPTGDTAGLAMPTKPYVTFGCGFLDANNDGSLDLFLANGHVRDNVAKMEADQSYAQSPQLFANRGDGSFIEVSRGAGPAFADRLVGRGAAFGDYDNDGRVDILVMDLEGRPRLLHNEGGPRCGNWALVRLQGGGRNPEAIGARVTLEAGGRRQTREITRGRSVLSASDPRAHFGLGGVSSIDRILVRWPGGATEEWKSQPANRILSLRRGTGTPANQPAL